MDLLNISMLSIKEQPSNDIVSPNIKTKETQIANDEEALLWSLVQATSTRNKIYKINHSSKSRHSLCPT